MSTASITHQREEEEKRLLALKEQYAQEILDNDERCALLDRIVKLERKLGRR